MFGTGVNMRIKLNGWQRVGIVLSVIWFVGFWFYSAREPTPAADAQLKLCFTEFENDKYSSETSKRFDDCLRTANAKRFIEMYQFRKDIPGIIVADVVTIIIGWFVGWLAIVVGRWIRRGFA